MKISLIILCAAWVAGGVFPQPVCAGEPRVIKSSDSVVDPRALQLQGGHWGNAVNGQSFQQEALVSFKGWQYATYYNADRQLCVARRQARNPRWEIIRFEDHHFKGNDSHNVSVMGICAADGTIHLAFDHHGHALRYRRSAPGLALKPESFEWNSKVFGGITNELEPGKVLSGVTYPRFLRTPQGGLQFGCRIGGSGNGDKCLADYDPKSGTWRNFGAFVGRNGVYGTSSSRNAYLNGLTYDSQGRLHVTWCWRETGDPMTNHDLGYAWSDDGGRSWFNNLNSAVGACGEQLITIDSPGVRVVEIGMNRGLVNATTQAVDSRNRIHLVTMHLADPEQAKASWKSMRQKAHYFHYWRQEDGKWRRNRFEMTGSRPQLRFDPQDNAYLVLTGDRYHPSSDLTIAAASAESRWQDWRIAHSEPGPFMGQPRLDDVEGNPGKMAVYVQEEPKEPTSGESPLRVIEYEFALPVDDRRTSAHGERPPAATASPKRGSE